MRGLTVSPRHAQNNVTSQAGRLLLISLLHPRCHTGKDLSPSCVEHPRDTAELTKQILEITLTTLNFRCIGEAAATSGVKMASLIHCRGDNKSYVGVDCAFEQVATIQTDLFEKNARPRPSTPSRAVLNATEHRFLSGWRVGALVSLVGVLLVFTCNLALFLFVRSKHGTQSDGSIGTLFEGGCDRTRRLNTWVHLFVNVLSTLLLGASNYCMQILSAPTRDELIRAHGRRTWLHIGVPSLRNLRHIGLDR